MSDDRTRRAAFFETVYEQNLWNGKESLSGVGSELAAARGLIDGLPMLFKRLEIRSFLDVPCGDFNWMKAVPFGDIAYTGGDLVPSLVERNTARFGSPKRRFEVLDIVEDRLPDADMIFVRDCLIHMDNALVLRALDNIRRSSFRYLCLTHDLNDARFPGENVELDRAVNGVNFEFRPNNFELPPFSLPPPIEVLVEGEAWSEWHGVKAMAVWSSDQVETALVARGASPSC